MAFGYNGKILHVDLTSESFSVETPDPGFYRKFLGGSALNTYYLLRMIPIGIDPLSPENVLAVSVSVITGASVAGQSRVCIGSKSPLTGLVGDSQAGGFFPAEMKFSGFDAFIITGKSNSPKYLWVNDGKYELREANHLWGKVTGEVEDIIREELGDKYIEIAQIGPAGERGVLYANILNMCNRANGRTGMGAVMGSKNLKAIAVRGREGKKAFSVAFPEELRVLSREGNRRLKGSSQEVWAKYGTSIAMVPQNMTGQLPTNNFNSGEFIDAQNISGEAQYDTYLRGAKEGKQDSLGRDTCYACPIRCKRVFEIKEGKILVDPRYGGPEYETLSLMGSSCGINDLVAIAKANEICSKFGIDTISCGGTIAWAMECFENGVITIDDTNGLELRFGNIPAYLQIIELIGKREGFGDILAQGSVRASEIIGKGSEKFLVAANGQEFPGHMPRVKVGLGVNYAVNPHGADHMSSDHDPSYEVDSDKKNPDGSQILPKLTPEFIELGLTSPTNPRSLDAEKMRFLMVTQNYHSFLDSLCFCMCVTLGGMYKPSDLASIINLVTGWNMTVQELQLVGERKYNMMRLFNAREGYTKDKDRLPEKMYVPLVGGVTEGLCLDQNEINSALLDFYLQRGWDETTGNPSQAKLVELGLEWVSY